MHILLGLPYPLGQEHMSLTDYVFALYLLPLILINILVS